MFDIEKRLTANIGTFDNKKKKNEKFNAGIQWATHYQNEASKSRTQEKKKLRKLAKKATENLDEIVNGLSAVTLASAPLKVFIENIFKHVCLRIKHFTYATNIICKF